MGTARRRVVFSVLVGTAMFTGYTVLVASAAIGAQRGTGDTRDQRADAGLSPDHRVVAPPTGPTAVALTQLTKGKRRDFGQVSGTDDDAV